MRVVPGFNKLEDSHSGLGLGLEASPVEELTLQSGKETEVVWQKRNHAPAFKAQKGDQTIVELAECYQVHPNQITEWKKQLLAHAEEISGSRIKGRSSKIFMPRLDNFR